MNQTTGMPPFDPKLKEAEDKIKGIMDEYDVAGMVVLCSKTHTEAIYKLDPTWSAATMEGTQFKMKQEVIQNPGEADERRRMDKYLQTLSMIMSIRVHIGQLHMTYMACETAVRKWIGDRHPDAFKKPPTNGRKN